MRLSDYTREYKAIFRLGVPITVAQLGMTLQGLADTIMVGRHSAEELAAAGFVNAIYLLAILLLLGYSQGAISRIGSLYSRGRHRDIVGVLKSSIFADGAQCLVITSLMLLFYFLLPYMGQDARLLPYMQSYFLILLPSLPFFTMASVFKPFSDSINDTQTPMWIMLASNVWNIFFNWVLIYGHLGFPEMGIDGAGWATLTSRLFMAVLYYIIFFGTRRYERYRACWREVRASWSEAWQLNRLGWPIAIQMGMETASFSLVTIFLGWGGDGWDGVTALAAHQIVLQLSSFIFLFYIGVSSAVAIRVSNYHGMSDLHGVRRAADAGYHLILLLGIVLSIMAFACRHEVTAWFIESDDPDLLARVSAIVASMAYPLILYQLGDGIQANYVHALRGFGDVKVLMGYSALAYLVISLPLSYLFGVVFDGGAFGVWMGFPFGLSTAAVLFFLRFRKVTRLRHLHG